MNFKVKELFYENKRKKYSSIIFGNGFNYAVMGELASEVEEEYKYLLNMKEFLVRLKLFEQKEYHDNYVELAEFILEHSHRRKFIEVCEKIEKYNLGIDAVELIVNLEPNLFIFAYNFAKETFFTAGDLIFFGTMLLYGEDKEGNKVKLKERIRENNYRKLFRKLDSRMGIKKKEFDLLLDDIYFYYNLFDAVQGSFISEKKYIIEKRKRYYKQFAKKYLKKDAIIMTTNYGLEIKEIYKNVEYLHGHFTKWTGENLQIRDETGHYAFLFGSSACHKHKEIEEGIYGKTFFQDSSRIYGDLLVYGISFAKIKELSKCDLRGSTYDFHIDMHILKRIDELFEMRKIDSLTVVAHNNTDKNNYENLFESFKKSKYTKIFSLYKSEKIRIMDEKDL